MGWFKTGNGEDLTGDIPADVVVIALRELGASTTSPTLDELLLALTRALKGNETRYLDRDETDEIGRIVHQDYGASKETEVSPRLMEFAAELATRLTRVYEEGLERKPRLSELLASLTLGLQGDLSGLLRESDDLEITAGDLREI